MTLREIILEEDIGAVEMSEGSTILSGLATGLSKSDNFLKR